MFTVTGLLDSVPYRVGIHETPPEGNATGCVMGSTHVTDLLSAYEGETAQATPTSDPVTLSLTDPASILVYLRANTEVDVVEGDVPTTEGDAANDGARY